MKHISHILLIASGFLACTFVAPHCLAAYSPTNVPGLTLWLSADSGIETNASGVVTNWLDRTTNGYNVSQSPAITEPTVVTNMINGLPVLRFNGAGRLTGPGIASIVVDTPRTIFLATIPKDPPVSSAEVFGYNTSYMIDLGSYDGASNPGHRVRVRQTANFYSGKDSCPYGEPRMITVLGDGSGTMVKADSTLPTNSATKYFHYALTTSFGVGWSSYASRSYRGDLAEVILYNRALTVSEQDHVYLYLSERYSIDSVCRTDEAVEVESDRATLRGRLTSTGLSTTALSVYIGTATNNMVLTNTWASATNGVYEFVATGLAEQTRYYFEFHATNSEDGAWSLDGPSSINTLAANAPTLPVTDGCVLHLAADAMAYTNNAFIDYWADLSGNLNHMTQFGSDTYKPRFIDQVASLNNKSAVRCDGSNRLTDDDGIGAIGADDPRSIFIVLIPQTQSGSSEIFGTGTSYMIDFGSGAWYNRVRLRQSDSLFTADGSVPYDTPHVFMACSDTNGTYAYSDGVLIANTTTNFFHYSLNAPLGVCWSTYGGRDYHGDIAELILYDSKLSAKDHNTMGYYLAKKYAIDTEYRSPGGTVIVIR